MSNVVLNFTNTKPFCKLCKYYVPFIYNNKVIDKYSKCSKFFLMSTNNVNQYPFANIMRNYDYHCGPSGKYHTVKPSIDI